MTHLSDLFVAGVPVTPGPIHTTGNVFFVDSGAGSDTGTYGRNADQPFATLDYAIDATTASNGDVIIVMPGHAETAPATTGMVVDKIGVSIVGLGNGDNRPTITAHASAIDCFNITADDVLIKNIKVVGAASCTALVNIGAADLTVEDCHFTHGAAPLVAVTIPAAGLRSTWRNCIFRGTADGPDKVFQIESTSVVGLTIEGCDAIYDKYGLDDAFIESSYTNEDIIISRCRVIGCDAATVDFNSSATGLIEYCSFVLSSGASTTVEESCDPGDMGFIETYTTHITESGTKIPSTTAEA